MSTGPSVSCNSPVSLEIALSSMSPAVTVPVTSICSAVTVSAAEPMSRFSMMTLSALPSPALIVNESVGAVKSVISNVTGVDVLATEIVVPD